MSIENFPWPVTIWLQRENADDIYISDYPDGTTWCSDKIGDNDIEYIQKSEYDELQRQLEKERKLFDNVNRRCGEVERQLAEREAVIEKLREALQKESDYQTRNYGDCRVWIEEALAIPTDHTALDEAKTRVLEEAANIIGSCKSECDKQLRRMADEIRSK